MSRQNPAERTEAARQRLDSRQKGLTTQLNNRTNTARTKLNARDSRQINQLVGDLTDLGPELPPPILRKEEPRGPIPAARGYMERNLQPGTGEGQDTAGIASPLIEGAAPPEADPDDPGAPTANKPKLEREYYPAGLVSSDGLFVLPALKKITMRDANSRSVVFEFAEPGASDEP